MKKTASAIVLQISLMLFVSTSHAFTFYSTEQINHFFTFALTMKEKQTENERVSCQTHFKDDLPVVASHESMEKAQALFVFKCLRYKCDHLSEILGKSLLDLQNNKNLDVLTLFRAMGHSPEVVAATEKALEGPLPKINATCTSISNTERSMLFDICRTQLIECWEIKK